MKINPISMAQTVSYTGSVKKHGTLYKQPAIEDKFIPPEDKTKEITQKAEKLTAKAHSSIQENINNDRKTMEYELYNAAYLIGEEMEYGNYEDYEDNSKKISFRHEGSDIIMTERNHKETKTTTFDPVKNKIKSVKISQNNYPDMYYLITYDSSNGTHSIYNGVKELPNGNKEYFSRTSSDLKNCRTSSDLKNCRTTYSINGEEYPDGRLKHSESTFVFENQKLVEYMSGTDEIQTDDGTFAEYSKEVFGFHKEKPVLYGTGVTVHADGKITYENKYVKSPGIFSKFKKVN